MTISFATVKRSNLMAISVVTMASKLFCFTFVVFNSIEKVVSECPYPAISNHGFGFEHYKKTKYFNLVAKNCGFRLVLSIFLLFVETVFYKGKISREV